MKRLLLLPLTPFLEIYRLQREVAHWRRMHTKAILCAARHCERADLAELRLSEFLEDSGTPVEPWVDFADEGRAT